MTAASLWISGAGDAPVQIPGLSQASWSKVGSFFAGFGRTEGGPGAKILGEAAGRYGLFKSKNG